MRSQLTFLALSGLVAACQPAPPTVDPLPLFAGYRDPADQCQRVGESPATNQYLDHTSVLVACPVGYEGIGVFVTETGAEQVGKLRNYVLFSVSSDLNSAI